MGACVHHSLPWGRLRGGDILPGAGFSTRIIDVDAVSLEGEERGRIVAALAMLASGEGTDTLVRMKAIAIAIAPR